MLDQLIWLTLCVYFEAQGEPQEGKVAVAHTVLNRVAKSNTTVKDVILKPWQFSWANQGARPPIRDYKALINCAEAVMITLDERLQGKDFWRADHYYNPAKANPKWDFKKLQFIKEVGGHKFYKHL